MIYQNNIKTYTVKVITLEVVLDARPYGDDMETASGDMVDEIQSAFADNISAADSHSIICTSTAFLHDPEAETLSAEFELTTHKELTQ